MIWWVWVAVGSLLLAFEIITPGGFYIFFFGAGAIITGLLLLLGIPMTLSVQIIIFLLLSILSLFLFRKRLLAIMETKQGLDKVDKMEGERVIATTDIPVNEFGQVEFRGVPWKAKNIGLKTIEKDNSCYIKKVNGLQFEVSTEE